MRVFQFDGDDRAWEVVGPLDTDSHQSDTHVLEVVDLRTGEPCVAKIRPNDDWSRREADVAEALKNRADAINVVPIIASGVDGEDLVLIMPKAQRSLRQLISKHDGPLSVEEVVQVLRDAASSLASLAADIVHRDIKPENILFYDGRWRLADFGTAREAQAETASVTHKMQMTFRYASPEQCRLEHATPASDVYALGVVGYELLVGDRPFPGPEGADYRDQHINRMAPAITIGPIPLRMLLTRCLSKDPSGRPTVLDVVNTLNGMSLSGSEMPGRLRFQAAALAETERVAKELAATAAARSAQEVRDLRFQDALSEFGLIENTLSDALLAGGGDAVKVATGDALTGAARAAMSFEAEVGSGSLGLSLPVAPDQEWNGPFEVIACAAIVVRNIPDGDRTRLTGRAHSLWYCDALIEGEFQWHELAFASSILNARSGAVVPEALLPHDAETAFTHVLGLTNLRVAGEIEPVTALNIEAFVDRWLGWLGGAASEPVPVPMSLPESQTAPNWRGR